MASILTRELGSELTANCHKNHNGTDSLHDRIDGYTNKYNISNRCENLGSKQCRYEIETTGKLPDEMAIWEKKKTSRRGTSGPARVRSKALNAIGNQYNAVDLDSQAKQIWSNDLALPRRKQS